MGKRKRGSRLVKDKKRSWKLVEFVSLLFQNKHKNVSLHTAARACEDFNLH